MADEEVGAYALAAITRFFLARHLTHAGEIVEARKVLAQQAESFRTWNISRWLGTCEKDLSALQLGN